MFEQRLEALRRSLADSKLDALLVTHLPHVRYLTGFSGSNGLCIIGKRSRCFLTDNRYVGQAREEARAYRVVITRRSLFEAAAKQPVLSGKTRLGFEGQYLSVAGFATLKKRLPRVTFVQTQSLVERLASVKDAVEVRLIRRAVEISDKVFCRIVEFVRPGMTELDVAAEIGYLHRKFGAEADAFEPIVASGWRGALPHARASTKKIRSGELVTLDFGCRVEGYNSDLTRTVAVGRPTARARRIYQVVLDAQMRAIEAARRGMTAKVLDGVARSHIRKKGYGKYFSHSLGHGLGLQVHEAPRISSLSKDVLQDGNVVTIEPGIYVPGVGGVRIEDDVVIRDNHPEVLTKSPKELLIL
ncbi:MAG: Xaa-Pro peptidase family protein [Bacteroidota bacterium]